MEEFFQILCFPSWHVFLGAVQGKRNSQKNEVLLYIQSTHSNLRFLLIRTEAVVSASLHVNPWEKSLANLRTKMQHRLIRSDSSMHRFHEMHDF